MVNQMIEDKRYVVKGSDDFFLHIEDTTFHEDKHEGAIYNIYQVVRRLNEQDERIKELEKENYILSVTVQRNESYIKRLTTKGKWSNTGDVK